MAGITTSSYNVPSRTIKTPSFLSPIAQAFNTPQHVTPAYPPIEDKAAWRALIQQTNRNMAHMLQATAEKLAVETTTREVDGVAVHEAVPACLSAENRSIILDFHGGGLIFCGGEVCKCMAEMNAARMQKRVLSVDYRMPPDGPFPAALDDGLAIYRALLKERTPADIIICGTSAGGNIAAAVLLRIREAGLPMPAGLILCTPEADLTESGDSFQTNMGVDTVLQSLMPINLFYANGADLRDPHVSPLFGNLKDFPPTILTTGTRDLFLSNTVRMHRALRSAGVPAELHVMEAASHIAFPGSPEAEEIDKEVRLFIARVLVA